MRLHEQFHIPENWALDAFGRQKLEQALRSAEHRILQRALGQVVSVPTVVDDDPDLVETAVHTCEIAALEWWDAARFPDGENAENARKFSQVCGIACTLLQALPLPASPETKVSHILRVIALGYLADRATDVRRWINELGDEVWVEMEGWNGRLVSKILETWVRLVRRKDWDEVSQIAQIIHALRQEQREQEGTYLANQNQEDVIATSWQLISFYHWAKATEVLAEFMLQGTPVDAEGIIDIHFEKSFIAAEQSGSFELGNLLRWLQLASHRLIQNAIWNVSKRFNSNITRYVQRLVKSSRTTLELLPPQRKAIFEEGLLDRTHNAIVVSLPTSSGKTQLAIFRILEAINHFGDRNAWIAYTAPTRALVNQISVRLRRELAPLGIRVERLSGAAEVDQLEEDMLTDANAFQVLVCTPEKLDLIIRQRKVKRDLVLMIMDEAHNLEDKDRGLKHELMLAMIKRDCPSAKFLLLTPFVANGREIARWLDPQAPGAVGISIDWKPNDRVIGKFWAEAGMKPRNWVMKFESLATTHPSLGFDGPVTVGKPGPLPKPYSQVRNNLTRLTAAMAASLQARGTVLMIAQDKLDAWSAATQLKDVLPEREKVSGEVESVIHFLQAEYGAEYELASLLRHGIAVHHSGLSDEARFLVEWLTEEEQIRVLCATTTIAQGINFPVSSILLSSVKHPYGQKMNYREFWNLVGRAGRLDQPGVGFIGIATRSGTLGEDERLIEGYLQSAHETLLSSLISLYNQAKQQYGELDLSLLANMPTWSAFLQYLAHLFNQSGRDRLLGAQLELILRDTFGFISLERNNPAAARELVMAVRKYIAELDPGMAKLAEETGFAPENVRIAIQEMRDVRIQHSDWNPNRIFSGNGNVLRKLMGVMLRVPELSRNLKEISGNGLSQKQLAMLTTDWVNGKSLRELAQRYFQGTDAKALTRCCDAIYGKLINNATWGLAALQKLVGLDWDSMDESARRQINILPAMIYYGVNNEEAVLMRMNGVPRSLAHHAGAEYRKHNGKRARISPQDVLDWLSNLDANNWAKILPNNHPMTGVDCVTIWRKLSGVK